MPKQDVTPEDTPNTGRDKWNANFAEVYTNVTNLTTALDGKAATAHTHAIADTTGLQGALDGKAATTHTHNLDALTDVVITTPATGQVVIHNGTNFVNRAVDYAEVANKPATFPPSAHTHAIADVTNLQAALDGKTAPSDAAPLLYAINAAVGTAITAARADHRHPLGGVWHQRFATGGYYGAYSLANSTVQAAGLLHASPFFVPFTRTFDRILINVTTAGVGPIRLGIYGDTGAGYPGSLLLSAGTVDSAVLGELLITISQQLAPGLYWLSALAETTTNATVTSVGNQVLGASLIPGTSSKGFQASAIAAGALPNPFPADQGPSSSAIWRVLLRAA